MNLFRSTAAVIATLGVALAAGNLFQPGSAPESASDHPFENDSASLAVPFSDAADTDFALPLPAADDKMVATVTEVPAPITLSARPGNSLAEMRRLARLTRQLPEPPQWLRAVGSAAEVATAAHATQPDPLAANAACEIWLVITTAPQAMLDLSLYAPCDGGARVEIHHDALHFSQTLTDDGQMMLALPALAAEARVTVTLPDGRRVADATDVPEIALTDRLLLGWQGGNALSLSAHVGGAVHGDDGHIHPAQPGSAGNGVQHGFLTLLGDPALDDAALAQIFTFPAGLGADSGHVDLAVEAAISPESCGQRISAETHLVRGGHVASPRRLTLTMPECDGFEGFLVIDGLIPDLTLAQN